MCVFSLVFLQWINSCSEQQIGLIFIKIDLIVIDCSIVFFLVFQSIYINLFIHEYLIMSTTSTVAAASAVVFVVVVVAWIEPHIIHYYFHYIDLNEFRCPSPNTRLFACTLLNYFPFCLLLSECNSRSIQLQNTIIFNSSINKHLHTFFRIFIHIILFVFFL